MSKPLAVVREYSDMHRALRARAEDLNISRATIDAIGGLTAGHAGKILGPGQTKCIGMKTLGPVLGALALKLLVVEDEEALAKIKRRLEPRSPKRARLENRNWQTHRLVQEARSDGTINEATS